jgi:PBP1b-binding outer membrane lipoprotein LpoB
VTGIPKKNPMNKFIIPILAAAALATLAGCESTPAPTHSTTTTTEQTTVPAPVTTTTTDTTHSN